MLGRTFSTKFIAAMLLLQLKSIFTSGIQSSPSKADVINGVSTA